tara:strand:+ start:8384 stop:8653 length:270 start_codon:yes stop_codon:yes gene_type:complete
MRTKTNKSDRIKSLVGSRFFSVNVKRGAKTTTMHCRLNVNSWGQLTPMEPKTRKGYLTVFDVRSKKYTGLSETTIKSVTFNGRTYQMRG